MTAIASDARLKAYGEVAKAINEFFETRFDGDPLNELERALVAAKLIAATTGLSIGEALATIPRDQRKAATSQIIAGHLLPIIASEAALAAHAIGKPN